MMVILVQLKSPGLLVNDKYLIIDIFRQPKTLLCCATFQEHKFLRRQKCRVRALVCETVRVLLTMISGDTVEDVDIPDGGIAQQDFQLWL